MFHYRHYTEMEMRDVRGFISIIAKDVWWVCECPYVDLNKDATTSSRYFVWGSFYIYINSPKLLATGYKLVR